MQGRHGGQQRAEPQPDDHDQRDEAHADAHHVRQRPHEAEVHARRHQHHVVGARRGRRDEGEDDQGEESVCAHGDAAPSLRGPDQAGIGKPSLAWTRWTAGRAATRRACAVQCGKSPSIA